MSFLATLNRSIFKRTSTFVLAAACGAFFFERTFDVVTLKIFESINKGKLWKDVEHKFSQPAE